MSRAPKHPTLPQNDTPQQQAARTAQLAEARGTYAWSTTVPSLPGVPLATKVPKADEPTVDWLFKVLEVVLKVAENAIEVKLAGGDDPAEGAANAKERHGEIAASVDSIRRTIDRVDDGGLITKIAGVVAPLLGHHEKLLGHLTELKGMVEAHRHTGSTGASLADYDDLFRAIALPRVASNFMEDDTFSKLRVAGPNPMLIKNISALPSNFPVTNAQYQATMGDGDDLSKALADGRIFLLDYAELSALKPGIWQGLPQFPFVPLALFAVPLSGDSLRPGPYRQPCLHARH